jgi:hypothetical protein
MPSKINGFYIRRKKQNGSNNLFIFTFMQEVLEVTSHVHGQTTQFCMKNKQVSVRRFRTYPLFHLQIVEFDATVPLYWHRLDFQTSALKKKTFERIQVWLACRPGNCSVREKSSAQDNFRTAVDAFHHCSVAAHSLAESTFEVAH